MDKLQRFINTGSGLWIVFLSWTLFVSNLWLPRNWGFYGNADWDLTYSTFEAARISIVKYGEWPSYQPWLAFGSDLNANPQSVHASIFFLPVLIFGSFYGYKISILLAILIGLWGCFRLFKTLGADNIISVSMAMVFCGAAYFSRHLFEAGHSNFLFFYFLPFLAFCLLEFEKSRSIKYALGIIFLLAQAIFAGAPLVFIISASLMILWSIAKVIIEKNKVSLVWFSLTCIGFALAISAWKILPVMEFWKESPRLVNDDSQINFLIWLQSLSDLKTDSKTPHEWHEFAIGFPLVLIAITLFYRKNIPDFTKWILFFIPIVWINMGNIPNTFNPWYFLNHNIPVFNSLRAPYRIGILSVLILSIAFIKSIIKIENKQLIYTILFAITLTQTLGFNSISNSMVYSKRIEEIPVQKFAIHSSIFLKPSQDQFVFLKKEALILNAYEPLHLSPVNDSLNTFIEGGKITAFSPSHFKILSSDSLVKICLRYDKHWSLNGKGQLLDKNGLLCIENPGHEIEVKYNNPAVKKGLILSFSAIVLLSICSLIYQRKHNQEIA